MERRLLCSCALLLAFLQPDVLRGQVLHRHDEPATPAADSDETNLPAGVDILSDTGGVNVEPYIKQIMRMIYKSWLPLVPQEAKPPELKQAEAQIRFKVLEDGEIGGMWLDGSTHDDAINRSCWSAIAGVQKFPRLPAGLEDKPLVLRIHFYVNTKPHPATAASAQQ